MSVYLNAAASQFNGIVQYTTLAVIQSMILAAGKPVFARLADVLGRALTLIISVLLFTVGTVTIAASSEIGALAAGMVFFSLGNTGVSFVIQVIVSDLTSPRWRCSISNLLTLHFVINFGIASKITNALVPQNWRCKYFIFSKAAALKHESFGLPLFYRHSLLISCRGCGNVHNHQSLCHSTHHRRPSLAAVLFGSPERHT